MKQVPRKFIPSTLAFLYFVTHCLLGHAAETDWWKERTHALASAVSPFPTQISERLKSRSSINDLSRWGTVEPTEKIFSNASSTVIHIQDIHLNQEAQSNISGFIEHLIERNEISLLALEGAFSTVNVASLREYPDREAMNMVANYLLQEGRISGAVHAALITRNPSPSVVGIDDRNLYDQNVSAYQHASPKRERLTTTLDRLRDDLIKEQLVELNPALLNHHQQLEAFHDGKIPLSDYLELLCRVSQISSNEIKMFLSAHGMERTINFSAAEAERRKLLTQLRSQIHTPDSEALSNGTHFDFYS